MASTSRTKTEPTEYVEEVMPERMADKANGVAVQAHRFSDEQLSSIESFDDVTALLAAEGITLDSADEVLGNGFTILDKDEKGMLVGIPLVCLSWQFNAGDNGEFVSINIVAKMPGNVVPSKFVVNDGSTGIRDQLKAYSNKTGKFAGLTVKRGFRRSDYPYTDADGKTRTATTFYLDTSAK